MSTGFVLFCDAAGFRAMPEAMLGQCRAIIVDARRVPLDQARGWRPDTPVMAHPPISERAAFERTVRDFDAGLGVICSYSRILWPALLDGFRLGVINVHNAPLPAYRGANVLQWVLINGETETAATLHYVDEGVDTGPVIDRRPVAIAPSDTALSLRDKLLMEDRGLLETWLPRLLAGPVPANPQDAALACAWPRRNPEDGRIDWAKSDREISNLTRALVAPWPGAWYLLPSGERTVIDHALSPEEVARLRREVAS